MKKIGFIGVGVMGKSMVRNLMKEGYEVSIYTRTKSKVEDVISEGATWCDDVASCAANKDAVITIVGYPKDIEEVYFGEQGILENANPGTYIIDMTTTSPEQAITIYNKASEKNLHALDAPVSGGDNGARTATLSIMIGGDEAAYTTCLPLFEAMGKNIVYQGKAGAGQHTKMANQIAIAGTLAGVCEAISYGNKMGLDTEKMLSSISQGAAGSWQMTNLAPRILKDDLAAGFYLKHFVKDMSLAMEEADKAGLKLDVLKTTLHNLKVLEAKGYGDLGTHALIKYYQ
ncbi:MAG: NAD(P)-dependent oxidoreductase [Candidatus Woesearchaeota archaeon]